MHPILHPILLSLGGLCPCRPLDALNGFPLIMKHLVLLLVVRAENQTVRHGLAKVWPCQPLAALNSLSCTFSSFRLPAGGPVGKTRPTRMVEPRSGLARRWRLQTSFLNIIYMYIHLFIYKYYYMIQSLRAIRCAMLSAEGTPMKIWVVPALLSTEGCRNRLQGSAPRC